MLGFSFKIFFFSPNTINICLNKHTQLGSPSIQLNKICISDKNVQKKINKKKTRIIGVSNNNDKKNKFLNGSDKRKFGAKNMENYLKYTGHTLQIG